MAVHSAEVKVLCGELEGLVDQIEIVERTLEVCFDDDNADHGAGLHLRVIRDLRSRFRQKMSVISSASCLAWWIR
jgi:hypothetical protein